MATYGVHITGFKPGAEWGHTVAREFEAASRAEATAAGRAWLTVEGYDVSRSAVEIVADGATFREHMTRELVNLGARMSLRHGVSMTGPFHSADGDGSPRCVIRLFAANGRGVSVSSKLTDGYTRSEFIAIREDVTDPHGWLFDHEVQEYSEGTGVGEGHDGDVSSLLGKITGLPRK